MRPIPSDWSPAWSSEHWTFWYLLFSYCINLEIRSMTLTTSLILVHAAFFLVFETLTSVFARYHCLGNYFLNFYPYFWVSLYQILLSHTAIMACVVLRGPSFCTPEEWILLRDFYVYKAVVDLTWNIEIAYKFAHGVTDLKGFVACTHPSPRYK